jgi:hypothetical protein
MFVNVLGIKNADEGTWDAVALEMDLWGHGATFEKALRDLQGLVKMQISFALSQGAPQMIYKPASPDLFEIFLRVRTEALKALQAKERNERFETRGLPIPPAFMVGSPSSWANG